MTITTTSEKETYELGISYGEKAKAGDIICLDGDLGAGKTVFTKGFAEGLGVKDIVNSPTFTIVHEYEDGRIPLYHFDVYRIEEPDEMYEIGADEYFFGNGVCLIEWAKIIEDMIPEGATKIEILRDASKGEDYREIYISDSKN